MQFVLIPFALCFLLYIRQENRYRFRAATALKVTLTLALCLTVALLRRYSPALLAADLGMVLCAGGDFFLQYIRRSSRKFTCGILLFSLGHVCNLAALFLLGPFHWSAGEPSAGPGRAAVLPVGHGPGDLELPKGPHPPGGSELAAVFLRSISPVRRVYRRSMICADRIC